MTDSNGMKGMTTVFPVPGAHSYGLCQIAAENGGICVHPASSGGYADRGLSPGVSYGFVDCHHCPVQHAISAAGEEFCSKKVKEETVERRSLFLWISR